MQKPSEKFRKVILLLTTWGVLLGFFLGYEHYFVDSQKEYLIDREFRNLGRLSTQLTAEFDRARLSVSSLAKVMQSVKEKPGGAELNQKCIGTETSGICFEALEYSKSYLSGIWSGKSPTLRFLNCLGENSETIGLKQVKNVSQLTVFVQCPASEKAESQGLKNEAQSDSFLRMDMKPWVQSAFEQYKNSFEEILVADESGRVLFQQSETGPRIAELGPVLAKGTDISAKQNMFGFQGSAPQETATTRPADSKPAEGSRSNTPARSGSGTEPGAQRKAAPERLERLSQGSSATKLAIGGKEYLLFAQPSPVAIGNGSEEGSHWNLVLVGLRQASSIEAESHAMPYSVLIWLALCAVVLLGFSWPWFKLQYMSNTERFRPHDGWLLLFTLLLVCAGLTLMLLNASYLQRSTARADEALQRLADQIKANFGTEISRGLCELEEIRDTDQFRDAFKENKGYKWIGSYPVENDVGRSYPYFEILFWGDEQGNQVAKLDVRKVATPARNLNDFAFYQAVRAEVKWENANDEKATQPCLSLSADRNLKCSFFQPILSPNTNEFAPILASPFPRKSHANLPDGMEGIDRPAVQVLVFRPMSVIDPVLPPGYGFAVIDSNCLVLFHSDSFRDMRENFCEEAKDRSELHPWLFRGVSTPLNITYGGKGKRAYLTNFPLPGLSADQATYLIVFQEGDQQLTLDLAVNLVCSILLGFYFTVLIVAAAGHLILRGPLQWDYAPHIVWPGREFATKYLQIFGFNVLLCLLYRNFYHHLHEAPLVALTLGVAFLATLYAVVRLSFSPGVLLGFGIAIVSAAVLTWLGLLVIYWKLHANISPSAVESLTEWRAFPSLALGFGVFAIFLSGEFQWFTNRLQLNTAFWSNFRKSLSKRSNLLYSLAAVSLMACVSVIPCAGFFKYAYDAVSEIALKHDEVVFAERLVARKNRIANYYKPLNARHIAEARRLESLDRYDKYEQNTLKAGDNVFFQTCNEPAFEGPPDNKGCPVATKKDQVDFGLNDWIERQIAGATLTFPSNELGSEINRLGVAETNESESWEYYWLEPSATTFLLRWKEQSRAPFFNIWAKYPEWQGLQNWARVCLPLFLAVLVFWLISLAKKIFLTNVEGAPAIEIVNWQKVSDIKHDYLVIGLPRSGKSAQLKKLKGLDPRDFRDVRDFQSDRTSVSKVCALESTEGHCGVIFIDQFDFNMRDPAWNQKRLDLLSHLLSETDQKLVLVSTVDPLYFLAEERRNVLCNEAEAKEVEFLLERWARALDKLSRVKLSSTVGDEFAEKAGEFFDRGGPFAQFSKWICEECSYTPMLQTIGVELLEKFQKLSLPTRPQLVRLVADRADAFYRMLWAGLTGSERLVLYQIALDGWANPKNASAIQQLEQKQIIYRRPMYRIMNDSFRSFIRSSEHAEEIAEWQKQEQQSAWPILRFAMIAGIIGVGVWLLYAQAQLFQIGTGYITAIAALLTAIAGIASRTKRSTTPPADSGTASY